MTSRILLIRASVMIMLVTLATTSVPSVAYAQTENKTQAIEIKITQLNIPTVHAISGLLNKPADPAQLVTVEIQPNIQAAAIQVEEVVEIPVKKISYNIPPKVTGDARVYMHEPEILEYICPKMGQRDCTIFMAVLKAENGTHECTRDNRGLNRNGSVDIGLAQINWKPGNPWHTYEQLQDCKYNLDVALEMYSRRGFQPWYAYTKGAYKKFLSTVN